MIIIYYVRYIQRLYLVNAIDLTYNSLCSYLCPHVDYQSLYFSCEKLEIDPDYKKDNVPDGEAPKHSCNSKVPIPQNIDLEYDDDQVGKHLMKHFDYLLKELRKVGFPIKCSEQSTSHDKDDESEHGAANDGMKVVEDIFFLGLNEAIGDEVPEDEEVGEEHDEEAVDHVEEGSSAVVLEHPQDDVNVKEDDPCDRLSYFVCKYLVVGGSFRHFFVLVLNLFEISIQFQQILHQILLSNNIKSYLQYYFKICLKIIDERFIQKFLTSFPVAFSQSSTCTPLGKAKSTPFHTILASLPCKFPPLAIFSLISYLIFHLFPPFIPYYSHPIASNDTHNRSICR